MKTPDEVAAELVPVWQEEGGSGGWFIGFEQGDGDAFTSYQHGSEEEALMYAGPLRERIANAIRAALQEQEAELLPLLSDRVQDSDLARWAVAQERERCARIAEALGKELRADGQIEEAYVADAIARDIRKEPV